MTVRSVELLMAVVLALLSIAIMVKATDGLSIRWVPGTGPGSGVWPFWLSLLMLLSCLTTIVRWFMGATPQSRSTEMFMDRHTVQVVGITVAALFMLILGMYFIGIYFSLIFFLLFYLRVLGGHTWKLTATLMFGIPIFIFFFFEYLLTIPLPKGEWIPDQVYLPLYRIMYGY